MARVRPPSRSRAASAWVLAAVFALTATACTSADQAATAPSTDTPSQAVKDGSNAPPAPGSPGAPPATSSTAAAFAISDLAVEGDPTAIRPGDIVTVSARVQNTGATSGTYDGLLTVDGSLVSRRLADLAPGESAILRFPVQISGGGRYDVRLEDLLLVLQVEAPAAFNLGTLDVAPNPAEAGDRITVRVTVTNTGGETGTQAVRLRIDGKLVGTKEATVTAGGDTVVAFSLAAPGAGRHTVSAGDLETSLVVWKIARQPNGRVLFNKLAGGHGKLTVRNRGERDAVLVLAKPSAPQKALLAVYVRAGNSATLDGIRDGSYAVYFTQGTRWDTYSRRFTASQEHRRFDDTIRFRTTSTSTQIHYVSWTLTLDVQHGGNAPTTWVGDDDFPGVP